MTKSNAKKAVVVAMAAITGCAMRPTCAAAKAAIADMASELGEECLFSIESDYSIEGIMLY